MLPRVFLAAARATALRLRADPRDLVVDVGRRPAARLERAVLGSVMAVGAWAIEWRLRSAARTRADPDAARTG
ncbi:MAG TPA: hypothetical protein VFC93_15015 [Chloroflexota bacterium]|nr:hypothetical protein [Chloroflexota bacterium]